MEKQIYKLFLLLLLIVSSSAVSFAEAPGRARLKLPAKESILIYPRRGSSLYEREPGSLNRRESWIVRINGLRFAPLHPEVWGIRNIDRTDNRGLVPIRPYYLRVSERKDFLVKEISFRFQFWPVEQQLMLTKPSHNDPVFDIGFSGEYQPGLKGERANRDANYLMRLTAFPGLESGMFYRSRTKLLKVSDATSNLLVPDQLYRVKLAFSKNKVETYLDGALFSSIAGENLNRGLVSLETGWHPIRLKDLNITGERNGKTVTQSGLVNLVKPTTKKEGE